MWRIGHRAKKEYIKYICDVKTWQRIIKMAVRRAVFIVVWFLSSEQKSNRNFEMKSKDLWSVVSAVKVSGFKSNFVIHSFYLYSNMYWWYLLVVKITNCLSFAILFQFKRVFSPPPPECLILKYSVVVPVSVQGIRVSTVLRFNAGVVLIHKFIQSRGCRSTADKEVGGESVYVDRFYRAESEGLEWAMWVRYR